MVEDPTVEPKALPAAPEPRGVDLGKLGWGVVLVGVGVLLLLDRLDLIFLEGYWRFWPLILIVLGGVSLAGGRTPEKRRSGLWLMGIGGWLLINLFEIGGFWWSDSWPLVVILAGVVDLVQPKTGESRAGGLWPLAIGSWLLVNTRGYWGLWWDNSWPVLLIVIGALLVFRALGEGWWSGRRDEEEQREGGAG